MLSIIKKPLSCLTTFACLSYSFSAFGMIVFDPTNFTENKITALQTIKLVEDSTQSLQNIKNMYGKISELRDIDLRNLQQLANLGDLVQSSNNTIDDSYGTVTSELTVLDPDKGNYTEQRDNVLTKYYEKPVDPNEVQASFQGEMSQDQLDAMKSQAMRQQRDYQMIQQTADDGANEQKKATKRQKIIDEHGNTIKNLGEKSELQTQQVIASEVNLQLQQNEQLIQQQNEALMNSKLRKADEVSEKAKETKYEESRLKGAINQGTGGLGRDKWGGM